MPITQQRPPLPSDPRYKTLDRTLKKFGYKKTSLIESLHAAQETFGFLEDDVMKFIAASLKLPLSKVYGVATFYHYFALKPAGEHTAVICTGTACYIKGAGKIMDSVCTKYEIKAGETTPDKKLSIMSARCIGCCGIAPAIVLDGNVNGTVSPETTLEKIEEMIR